MPLNPQIMKAVEQLNYRVTVGDVAAQSGLDVHLAERELLALASEAGGNLQVAESGDIAYLFPRDFRSVLWNKSFRLRLKSLWKKIWNVLFYIIRISFGLVLIVSILIIFLAIYILLASQSSRDNDSGSSTALPRVWISPNFFYFFSPGYYDRSYHTRQRFSSTDKPSMNFLEAIFSFLFGDGNPNANLEERRWQAIATVIRNNQGAVIAEQIAPYLDDVGTGHDREFESYMLPVLTRFNGRPEVSPNGELIYHFPELQTTAVENRLQSVSAYLKELPWVFSNAPVGQLWAAIGLGIANFAGAVILGNLLTDPRVILEAGSFIVFVESIYWFLLAYGTGFLVIPLVRYFWTRWRNRAIEQRNTQRQERASYLNEASAALEGKMTYAKQFAAANYIHRDDLIYTTEKDLIEQEIDQSDRIDQEWQRRLRQQQ